MVISLSVQARTRAQRVMEGIGRLQSLTQYDKLTDWEIIRR